MRRRRSLEEENDVVRVGYTEGVVFNKERGRVAEEEENGGRGCQVGGEAKEDWCKQ